MIVAGYNTSWQDSIDALAKGEKVIVLVYDSKQPTVRMYNFTEDEAEEMQGIIDEWLEEFYAD
ncbi:hypothetical protein ACTNBM_04490 [Lachnospiraceae bacterium HCP1S3_C3]